MWHLFCGCIKLLLTFSFNLYCCLFKLIFWSPNQTLIVIKKWYHVLKDNAYDLASILQIYWRTMLQSRVIPAKERWMIVFIYETQKNIHITNSALCLLDFFSRLSRLKDLLPWLQERLSTSLPSNCLCWWVLPPKHTFLENQLSENYTNKKFRGKVLPLRLIEKI